MAAEKRGHPVLPMWRVSRSDRCSQGRTAACLRLGRRALQRVLHFIGRSPEGLAPKLPGRRDRLIPALQCGLLDQCCVVSARGSMTDGRLDAALAFRCDRLQMTEPASRGFSFQRAQHSVDDRARVFRVMYPQLRACDHVSISIWSMSSATRTGWGRGRPLGPRGCTRRRVGKTSPAKCRWS